MMIGITTAGSSFQKRRRSSRFLFLHISAPIPVLQSMIPGENRRSPGAFLQVISKPSCCTAAYSAYSRKVIYLDNAD
jgi:hypothetical protein